MTTLELFNAELDRILDRMAPPDVLLARPSVWLRVVTDEALQVVLAGIDTTTDALVVNVLERLADDVLVLDADLDTRTVMASQALSLAARQRLEIVTLRQRLADLRGAA